MNQNSIYQTIGGMDIYLIDQIMKGRYSAGDKILDAGCGGGRNLHWFLQQEMMIYGVDQNETVIDGLRERVGGAAAGRFQSAPLERLPFEDDQFDHVICSAVL